MRYLFVILFRLFMDAHCGKKCVLVLQLTVSRANGPLQRILPSKHTSFERCKHFGQLERARPP